LKKLGHVKKNGKVENYSGFAAKTEQMVPLKFS
jgi:hypothetical protein